MNNIKALLANSVAHLRISELFHNGGAPTQLTVLMYHGIVEHQLRCPDWCFMHADAFRHQMEYLNEHFDVLPLANAIDHLQQGNSRRPMASITFDDGYRNNFTVALPILRKLNLPSTIFLCTDFVDSDETIWFCRLLDALGETQRDCLNWRGRTYSLKTQELKAQVSAALQTELKKQPPDELCRGLNSIFKELGCDSHRSTPLDSPFRILDRAAIREMCDTGLVEFGAHTRSHTILTHLSRSAQREEISGSIATVAALTGRPCRFFAYPNGTTHDYDAVSSNILRSTGVIAALTAIKEPNSNKTPLLEIRRCGIGARVSMAEYRHTIHHLSGVGRRLF